MDRDRLFFIRLPRLLVGAFGLRSDTIQLGTVSRLSLQGSDQPLGRVADPHAGDVDTSSCGSAAEVGPDGDMAEISRPSLASVAAMSAKRKLAAETSLQVDADDLCGCGGLLLD